MMYGVLLLYAQHPMLSLLDGLFGQNMRSSEVDDSVSVPSSKEDAIYIPFVKLLVWKFDKSQ